MNKLLIFVTLALSSATSVMAYKSLVLYEQANAPLIIDGVLQG